MAYINPTISTVKDKYETELIITSNNNTLFGGPIELPNTSLDECELVVIDELNISGKMRLISRFYPELNITDELTEETFSMFDVTTNSTYIGQGQVFFGDNLQTNKSGSHYIVHAPQADGYEGLVFLYDGFTNDLLNIIEYPYKTDPGTAQWGSALAMSNNYFSASSWFANSYTGVTATYSLATGNRQYVIYNNSAGDEVGLSIAMNDDFLVLRGRYHIRVHDTTTGQLLYYWVKTHNQRNDEKVNDLAVNSQYILYGSHTVGNNGTAGLFHIANGALEMTMTAPNIASDLFGFSVALTENRAIISAPGKDSNTGKAYIFSTKDGSLLHELSNPDPPDLTIVGYDPLKIFPFGRSVDINDEYAAVSYPSLNKVYVYDVESGNLLKTIDITHSSGIDKLVKLSEPFLLIGNSYGVAVNPLTNNNQMNAGLVYKYASEDLSSIPKKLPENINLHSQTLYTNAFTLSDKTSNYVTVLNDFFGNDIDTTEDGSLYIVGATSVDSGKGLAVVFDGITDEIKYTFEYPYTDYTANYGHGVAISKLYSAVSSYYYDNQNGLISIFNHKGDLLYHIFGSGTAEQLGSSIAINGSILVSKNRTEIKAFNLSDSNATLLYTINIGNTANSTDLNKDIDISNYYIASGFPEGEYVKLFNVSGGSQHYEVDNPRLLDLTYQWGVDDDNFGFSVAINNDYLVVGAPGMDANSGKVFVYQTSNLSTPLYTLDNPNNTSPSGNDYFGYSVDLNDDYIVASAYKEDSNINTDFGIVYVFDISTGNLINSIGQNLPSNLTNMLGLGHKVSLSNIKLLASAPSFQDGYVFSITSSDFSLYDNQDTILNIIG